MSRVTDLEREMIKHITRENEVLSSLLVRICEKLKVDETASDNIADESLTSMLNIFENYYMKLTHTEDVDYSSFAGMNDRDKEVYPIDPSDYQYISYDDGKEVMRNDHYHYRYFCDLLESARAINEECFNCMWHDSEECPKVKKWKLSKDGEYNCKGFSKKGSGKHNEV
jgi:hypothetical protein